MEPTAALDTNDWWMRGGGGGNDGLLVGRVGNQTSSFSVSAIPFIRALILFCTQTKIAIATHTHTHTHTHTNTERRKGEKRETSP